MHEKCDKTHEDVPMDQPNLGPGKRNLSTAMKPEDINRSVIYCLPLTYKTACNFPLIISKKIKCFQTG
jgi:hypothetical protein